MRNFSHAFRAEGRKILRKFWWRAKPRCAFAEATARQADHLSKTIQLSPSGPRCGSRPNPWTGARPCCWSRSRSSRRRRSRCSSRRCCCSGGSCCSRCGCCCRRRCPRRSGCRSRCSCRCKGRRRGRRRRWRVTTTAIRAGSIPRRRVTRRIAEVLHETSLAAGALHARRPLLRRAGAVDFAIDDFETLTRIVLANAQLEIAPRGVVTKEHRAPFDVEDPVGRSARYRCVNAAGPARIGRATAQARVSAQILEQCMNSEVMPRPRNAYSHKRAIASHKLGIPVRGNIHAAIAVPIQLE